ncbi:hypothetical protein GCM10027074_69310 [Streptomyces deserti]
MVGEHDRVLDGLVAALPERWRHGVRGVADQGDPAVMVGGQGLGDVVDVVPQHVLGAGGGQHGGDGVVPVAEAAQQFGLLVVGRALTGGGQGGGVRVDPAVLERVRAPDAAPAPALVRGEPHAGHRDQQTPGGESGVDGTGVVREQDTAYGRADAVRGHHEVGLQLAVGGADAGRAAGGAGVGDGRRDARADGARRQSRGQAVDEGGAGQQDQRAAEPFGRLGGTGTREPAPARGAQSPVARPGGEVPDRVAEPDDVQRAQGVGGQGDARADRLQ